MKTDPDRLEEMCGCQISSQVKTSVITGATGRDEDGTCTDKHGDDGTCTDKHGDDGACTDKHRDDGTCTDKRR